MKIGVKLNQLTHQEYIQILKNHRKYTDFNTRNKWLRQLKVQRQQSESREFQDKHIELVSNFSDESNL